MSITNIGTVFTYNWCNILEKGEVNFFFFEEPVSIQQPQGKLHSSKVDQKKWHMLHKRKYCENDTFDHMGKIVSVAWNLMHAIQVAVYGGYFKGKIGHLNQAKWHTLMTLRN